MGSYLFTVGEGYAKSSMEYISWCGGGEIRVTPGWACLIGYRASAIYPYLMYELIGELCQKGEIKVPYDKALFNYKKALEDGRLKIMSKMGISTLNSYQGAKIFDTVCLNRDFVEVLVEYL